MLTDDTSIFSVIYDLNISAATFNDNLEKINQWAFQWKMGFNPQISKRAQEVIFSRKNKKIIHPDLMFNNQKVEKTNTQKHLGLLLDEKLTFKNHIDLIINKASKGINVLRKLPYFLPRLPLLIIYKSFIRPHLDYGDVIYDQPNNTSVVKKVRVSPV